MANFLGDLADGIAVVLAAWTILECRRRWIGATGAASRTVRLVAASGMLLGATVGIRETLRFLVDHDLIGDFRPVVALAHTLSAVGALVLVAAAVVGGFLRRGRVVEALVARASDPAGLERAVRDELRDSSARLLYAVDDVWVTGDGTPASDPLKRIPAGRHREVLARTGDAPIVVADLAADNRLDSVRLRVTMSAVRLVLGATRTAVERDALAREVAASRTRIVEEGVSLRRRWERTLHDGVQQHLLATSATLSRARLAGGGGTSGATAELLGRAQAELDRTLAELRRVARGVHPVALGHGGLAGALAALPDVWPGVEVDVADDLGDDLDDTTSTTAYLVTAEALVNAHRYGAAPVSVLARREGDQVSIRISDQGSGGARRIPGGGLVGLGDRVAALDGQLRIDSPAGGPTDVTVTLPATLPASPATQDARP